MDRKISLTIGGKNFDVDVDESFASFLNKELSHDFHMERNNDILTLLQAYIRKAHNLYQQKQKIDAIIKKINDDDQI